MNDFVEALKKLVPVFTAKRCELCGEIIELDETCCDECKNTKMIMSPRCKYCGCSKDDCDCNKHKNEYKQIVAPYYYKDNIVKAVYQFKENDLQFLSKRFSADIYKVISECYKEIDFDVITFVPIRRFKKLKRGFNQSEMIAKELSKLMNVECVPLLKKIRYTGVQHHKTAQERKASVFASYDVIDSQKNNLTDKTILIIDDVKTTGSTLNECSKMLNIYGAKAVYASSFAITKKDKNKNKVDINKNAK